MSDDPDALEAQARATVPNFFGLAIMYAHLGEKDRALEWLTKGFEAGESNTRTFLGMPTFDVLRTDARFRALLQRMNLPD